MAFDKRLKEFCDHRNFWGVIIFACTVFMIVSIAIVLSGCDEPKSICTRSVNGKCVEKGHPPQPARVSATRSKGTEKRGPHLCVGVCVGPHINFATGQLELLSVGSVGLSLF
jgi:hypothetical protein